MVVGFSLTVSAVLEWRVEQFLLDERLVEFPEYWVLGLLEVLRQRYFWFRQVVPMNFLLQ